MYKSKIAGLLAGGVLFAGTALGIGEGLPDYTTNDLIIVSSAGPEHIRLGYDIDNDNIEDIAEIRPYNMNTGQTGKVIRLMWDKNKDGMFNGYDGEMFDVDEEGNYSRPKFPGETDA